jgi:phosphoribosylformimino-5-aminoimidazole carboxamide ribotide isomerase
MRIYPAIDLRGGSVVRLRQGDYDRQTLFSTNPNEVAMGFAAAGARYLHVVDLDGAREGRRCNDEVLGAILRTVGPDLAVQTGGGVRTEAAARGLVQMGIDRVIVGTRALQAFANFGAMTLADGLVGRVALAIDAREGRIATEGWLKTSAVDPIELARRVSGLPLAAIIYTDITKDGMMAGVNAKAYERMLQATDVPVVAAGGVTTLEDVRCLCELPLQGIIIGRALYEGTIDLADALEVAGPQVET